MSAAITLGKLDSGKGLALDLNRLVETRLLAQANSGGGKSWLLRRLLEQTHGRVQHLILDPEGEFASLRERFDYVLAAKGPGDTIADPRSAKLLAERLLELGVSAILDIYELKAHDRIRFVRYFLEALIDAPKKLWRPALIVVDEAHLYCPQAGEAESAAAVIDLATRGRKRGFCAVLATQRLAKLHKDAAAELNNKLIGRTGLDVDVKRAADELGFGKDRWPELRNLPEGHFFAFGPALSATVAQVHVGPVQTSHPKAGGRLAFTPPQPTEKIRALLPKLADLPAEAEQKQRTVDELRKENASLKAELKRKEAVLVKVDESTKRIEAGLARVKPLALIKPDHVKRLEAAAKRYEQAASSLHESAQKLVAEGERNAQEIKAALAAARDSQAHSASGGRGAVKLGVGEGRPLMPSRPAPVVPRTPRAEPQEGITPAKQRILDGLAFLEAIGVAQADKAQLALLADARPTSGAYFNNLGGLRSAGLITYPVPGTIALTDEGRAVADASTAPATTEELHRAIKAKIPPAKWKILEALIGCYPDRLGKDELAEQCGARATSGAYFNNLGSLRSLGLIDYPTPGYVAARPVLFLGGA